MYLIEHGPDECRFDAVNLVTNTTRILFNQTRSSCQNFSAQYPYLVWERNQGSGFSFRATTWVYDLRTGELRQIFTSGSGLGNYPVLGNGWVIALGTSIQGPILAHHLATGSEYVLYNDTTSLFSDHFMATNGRILVQNLYANSHDFQTLGPQLYWKELPKIEG